MLSFI